MSSGSSSSRSGVELAQAKNEAGEKQQQATNTALDEREEKDALYLAQADARFHKHINNTHHVFVVLCVVSLVASGLLLAATLWQRAQFDKLQQDFKVMSEVALYGEQAQRLVRAGHMRLYASKAGNSSDSRLFHEEYVVHAEQLLPQQKDVLLAYATTHEYGGAFQQDMQAAVDNVDDMTQLLTGLWTRNASDAVYTAEKLDFREKVTSVSVLNEQALTQLSSKARERRDYALTINTISFSATVGMLGVVTLGFALLVVRLLRSRTMNTEVLHALEACQQHEDAKAGKRRGSLSASMSESRYSDSSASEDLLPKESPAEQKLRHVTRLMKVVFSSFMVVSLGVYAVLCVSILLVRDAIDAYSSFEIKNVWTQMPAHFERVSTLAWLSMHSTFPFPSLHWTQANVDQLHDTAVLMNYLACDDSGVDEMEAVFGNAIDHTMALAAPLLLQQNVAMDPALLATLQGLIASGCIAEGLQIRPDRCYMDSLPSEVLDSSYLALFDSMHGLATQFMAMAFGSAVIFLPPATRSSLPPSILSTLPSSAPDPIICYPCEQFFSRQPYCSDQLLVHMLDESSMDADQLLPLAQAILGHPDVLNAQDNNAKLREDFFEQLNSLNTDQLLIVRPDVP